MFPDITPVVPSKKFITNCNHFRAYSSKLQRDVDAYSWLERVNLLLLEFNRKVTWYCEQPLKIDELIGGRRLVYTPDTLVYRPPLLIFQEIKPSDRLVNYDGRWLPRRWPLIEQWAESHDHQIEFQTEKDLLADRLRLRNLMFLAPFTRAAQYYFDSSLRRRIQQELHDEPPMNISAWVNRYADQSPTAVVGAIGILYQHGRCHLNLSKRLLTPDTTVHTHAPD